jgi:hypothetical protein
MKADDVALENELRRQAAAIRPEAPSGLNARIGFAVASMGKDAPLAARRRGLSGTALWWGGIGAAAAAAVALLFALRPAPAQFDSRAEAAALAQEMRGLPWQILSSVQPAAAALQKEPLHEEATALATDARSALGFLAYNFLPATSG